jgi:hypothetical protein
MKMWPTFLRSEKLDFQNEKIEKILFIGGVPRKISFSD